MNESPIFLSIIIVTYNTKYITKNCIESILASEIEFGYEIIVVDNCSSDETLDLINTQFPVVRTIGLKKNYGFSSANNIGFFSSRGSYILFLNSDTLVFKDTLRELCETLANNKFEVAAPKLLNEDLSLQKSLFRFPTHTRLFVRISGIYHPLYFLKNLLNFKKENCINLTNSNKNKFDYVSFAAIVVSNEVYRDLGMLDENILFYHEDCEFGYRLSKSPWRIAYLSDVSLIHLGGASTNIFSEFSFENDIVSLLYVFKKHRGFLSTLILRLVLFFAILIRTILTILKLHDGFERFLIYKKFDKKNKIVISSFLKFQLRLLKRVVFS